ncbi:MAG: DUF58 domain-containing protein [Pseudonocardiaceae bacterium]|nr:DUF58 domain-containing protein [Pseudonocardiaceae bacterium]
MRGASGGLTTRGRCLLAAGLAAALCALVLDERDLLRVAGFLVALPLLATLAAGRARLGLTAKRRMLPPRTPVGIASEVSLTVRATGRFGTGGLLLEDGVPAALGARPRFVVERLGRGSEVVLRYPLRPQLRGTHLVGPVVARITDPFGLAEFGLELGERHRLVATPVVVPLRGIPSGGGLGAGSDGTGRLHSGQGEDDVVVRSYRQGDDLRKVAWRATARYDELMVRVEERPWRGGTAVLLDHRAAAHRGHGRSASFECAVSLAASVCLHLQRHGQRVALTTGDGQVLAGAREVGDHSADAVLDALAALTPTHQRGLATAPVPAGGGDLVAILGAVTPDTVEALLRDRPRRGRNHAVLLDVGAFAPSEGRPAADPHDAARLLSAAGWSVTVAGPGQPLDSVWERLCTVPASRAGAPR